MAFTITAELPLGVYRGHEPDGRVERIPSVARLHSALLCAAGFGLRARPLDDGLAPSEEDEAALRWLESNPPDGVSIPALLVNRGPAIAYRDDGTWTKAKGCSTVNTLPKSGDTSVSVDGCFIWSWTELPPPEIVAALEALCPDVPHLGTAEAPVRLTSSRGDAAPTHRLDLDAGLFTAGGEDVELPRTGRLDELVAAHATAGRVPTQRQDATTANEVSRSPAPPRTAVRPARYVPVRVETSAVPWPEVLLLPMTEVVPERHRVRWAVAVHRALIHKVGDGAPPLLTGAYPDGAAPPSNRVALHFLDSAWPFDLPREYAGALAVMLPRGAGEADVSAVLGALRGLRTVRGPRGRLLTFGEDAQYVDGAQFWRAPGAGTVRLWRTSPAAVPDTRGSGTGWTFAHAALLSLGFVWQNTAHLPAVAGRGDVRNAGIVGAVNDAGAVAIAVEPLRTTAVHDYVHRVHPHAVVRPYRATLGLGALGGDRTLQAIGQARHLGGGLLVPFDVPEGTPLDDIEGPR